LYFCNTQEEYLQLEFTCELPAKNYVKEYEPANNQTWKIFFVFLKKICSSLGASQNCEKRLLAPSCLFVRPPAWNSCFTRRIFVKYDIYVFFENMSRKYKFQYNLTRITSTLQVDLSTLMIISRSTFLRIRDVADKSYRENQNTSYV